MRLLLHACCGPCLLEPYDVLSAEHEVTVAFANPNIHPADEYRRRLHTLAGHAEECGIEVVEAPYEPQRWVAAVGTSADDRDRCERCYLLRMRMVAETARRNGFEGIATTLTVSPHQDPDAVNSAGRRACEEQGLQYVATDFRDRYGQAVERSRRLGMYRQRYCGCILSEVEAERARRRRRAKRPERSP